MAKLPKPPAHALARTQTEAHTTHTFILHLHLPLHLLQPHAPGRAPRRLGLALHAQPRRVGAQELLGVRALVRRRLGRERRALPQLQRALLGDAREAQLLAQPVRFVFLV